MPYSIRVSQTHIFPGTTQFHFRINVKTRAQTRQLSMLARILACKLSNNVKPTDTNSSAIDVSTDTSL